MKSSEWGRKRESRSFKRLKYRILKFLKIFPERKTLCKIFVDLIFFVWEIKNPLCWAMEPTLKHTYKSGIWDCPVLGLILKGIKIQCLCVYVCMGVCTGGCVCVCGIVILLTTNKPWHQLSNLQQSSATLCFTHDYSLELDKCYATLLMPKI